MSKQITTISMNKLTKAQLTMLCEILETSQSETIRLAIDRLAYSIQDELKSLEQQPKEIKKRLREAKTLKNQQLPKVA